jgi:hypothetical protein
MSLPLHSAAHALHASFTWDTGLLRLATALGTRLLVQHIDGHEGLSQTAHRRDSIFGRTRACSRSWPRSLATDYQAQGALLPSWRLALADAGPILAARTLHAVRGKPSEIEERYEDEEDNDTTQDVSA